MCVCVCVCMYICTYACMYVCMYILESKKKVGKEKGGGAGGYPQDFSIQKLKYKKFRGTPPYSPHLLYYLLIVRRLLLFIP